MQALGEDFAGGWFRRLYQPVRPANVWRAVFITLALIVLHQVLQLVMAGGVLVTVLEGSPENTRDLVKATLIGLFPASLIVAYAAWRFAAAGGQDPRAVLNLKLPRLTLTGWIVLIAGFMICMYAAISVIVSVFGIDVSQYTPGPDGTSPKTGSAGLVKEAVYDIVNEPWLFALILPSIAIGAPLAEEVIFRGQLFSALSTTRLGVSGTALVTSAIWAGLHLSEPWFSVSLIFIMGLVFGWLMYRFGSLWVTIICHGVWNGSYALLIYFAAGHVR